jgi:hypothetical protein
MILLTAEYSSEDYGSGSSLDWEQFTSKSWGIDFYRSRNWREGNLINNNWFSHIFASGQGRSYSWDIVE